MTRNSFFRTIKTAKFQLSCIIFSIIYIVAILIWEHHRDIVPEEFFDVQEVNEEVKKHATNVEIGLYINNFPTFSFHTNEFTIDALVWFKFPSETKQIEKIKKFNFKNGKIIHKSEPIRKIIGNNTLLTYHVIVNLKSYLSFKDFPLGDHRLNIILDNINATPNEFCYNCDTENLVISEKILVANWRPIKKTVSSGYLISKLKETNKAMTVNHPCAVFVIDFELISLMHIFTLYFPMFVIFFICLFSLVVDISRHLDRVIIISSALPLLALFRLSITQQLYPMTGELTKADFIYFSLIYLALIILLFQVYVTIAMRKIKYYTEEVKLKKEAHLEKVNNIFFIIIIVLLIMFITYNDLIS